MSIASQEIGISHGQSRYDPGMVRKSWKLKASMQKEVDAALAILNSYEKPTIAFHVRGGDKSTEDQIMGRKTTKPEDLVNTFLDNYVNVRGGTCVLIGDDQALVAETERLAQTHIGCRVVRPSRYYRSKGHHQATFNSLPLHERCRETKQLIKDLEMMANADYFVGSSTSGIPTIIFTLRLSVYMKSQVTFADVSYDDMGTRIRRHFGIGGFKNVSIGKDTAKLLYRRRAMLTTPL
ncbi:g9225 [Coccomyxa elongata]